MTIIDLEERRRRGEGDADESAEFRDLLRRDPVEAVRRGLGLRSRGLVPLVAAGVCLLCLVAGLAVVVVSPLLFSVCLVWAAYEGAAFLLRRRRG